MEVIFATIGIGFVFLILTSILGLIYPFKPFRTRGRAGKTFGVSVVGFIAAVILSTEDADTSTTNNGESTVAAVESTVEDAASEIEEVVNTPVSDTDREQFIEQVQLLQFKEAHDTYLTLEKDHDMTTFRDEAEVEVLEVVRPLPADFHDKNQKGYELLAAIDPDNTEYDQKVAYYAQAAESARQAAINKLRKTEDKVDGITFYKHPNEPRYLNSRSTVYLYIGEKDGSQWLRMKTQYAADEWLFVNTVSAWHDGIKEPLTQGNFKTDHNTSIWEWKDESPNEYQLEVLRSLGNADEAILRFEGMDYRKDVTLSARDKRAIREVLLAYDSMNAK